MIVERNNIQDLFQANLIVVAYNGVHSVHMDTLCCRNFHLVPSSGIYFTSVKGDTKVEPLDIYTQVVCKLQANNREKAKMIEIPIMFVFPYKIS